MSKDHLRTSIAQLEKRLQYYKTLLFWSEKALEATLDMKEKNMIQKQKEVCEIEIRLMLKKLGDYYWLLED